MDPPLASPHQPTVDHQLMRACVSSHPAAGFTLLELLVVLAMATLLTVMALPAYQDHVRRTHRAAAQLTLMEAEHHLHRYHTARLSFVGATLPDALSRVPITGPAVYRVTLSLDAGQPQRFTLTATPVGTMSNDRCGTLSVDQTGRRTISNNAADTLPSDCFKAS
ncbi:type IV pilin protein [uncultured Pseudacidovorax sp.]|uniref:type IV pilin protein n=1 Tax=uncultured Pseudacidovorax sp. TaxID=679313 RepID=UPI0025DC3F6E|nr:type IV pilin protein [uncultured Pseudacidovorax sp.]